MTMEEDVEIEYLLKTHGQMLMEAAAASDKETFDKEEDNNKVKDSSKVQSLQNNKLKKKRRKRLTGNKKKRAKSNKENKVVNVDSSSDFEDLMNSELVNCLIQKSESGFEKCDEDDVVIKNVVNEISHDNLNNVTKWPEVNNSQPDHMNNEIAIKELTNLLQLLEERGEALGKKENELVNQLIENENKQTIIKDKLKSYSFDGGKKIKDLNFTKCFFIKFGIPYFHDDFGFYPSVNRDVKTRKQMGIPSLICLPKVKNWTDSDKDTLQDAIHATLKKEISERLVKEIDKLRDSMLKAVDEQSEIKIKNSIEKLQNQLQKTNFMSYLDMLANEAPDREYDWLKYSAKDFNGTRSADECRRFWHLYLKPTISKASWSESEDERLAELAQEKNYQDWDLIAKALGTNRSGYQVFINYKNRLCERQNFSMGKWTKEEDEKLLTVINSAKVGDYIPWTKVATCMGARTHNQIYNRYNNCLDPKLVKGKFSPEEDLLIVSGIEVFRVTYQELSSLMNQRTASQIRERYERHLLPKTSKIGTFSVEEDEILLKLIDKHGAGNFSLIAKTMKTRSRTQVRQRYNAIMNMKKADPDWTPASGKRRAVAIVPKSLQRTQKEVDKIRKEMETILNTFCLNDLENDTFRLEKLKELRNKLLLKKFDLKVSKKKSMTDNSEVNTQLIEYFKNNNEKKSTNLKMQCSGDSAAYLNEILLLAKYFGYDLELPKSADEIMGNKMLSHHLRSFLVENLKQQTVNADNHGQNDQISQTSPATEATDVDYVEPLIDNTLLMEDKWHKAETNISKLNFSEFFKRTVFDYSNGVHKDIWDAKMNRSTVPEFTSLTDQNTPIKQTFFIPPNSVTTLGLKSILLCRQRLRRDAKKKIDMQASEINRSLMYQSQDKFMETLLSLFYSPKVLSVIDLSETPMLLGNDRCQRNTFCGEISDLESYEANSMEIGSNENCVIEGDEDRQMKISKLEWKKRHLMKQQHLKVGLTFKRKMQIEHLLDHAKQDALKVKKESKRPRKNVEKLKKNKNNSLETTSTIEESSDVFTVNTTTNQVTYSRTLGSLRRTANSNISPLPVEDSIGSSSGINTIPLDSNLSTRATVEGQCDVTPSSEENQQ